MYIPAHFRETRIDILHSLIREHSFGTLTSFVDGHLFATHLPFLLDETRGPNGTLLGHMARGNPHWRGFEPGAESLVMFQGPHAYISPSWYATEPNVPTWNYVAVHAYGSASIIDDPIRIRRLLDATVGTFEPDGPQPWSTERLSPDYITNLARGIVAFDLPIERLEGKRKLGQNRLPVDVDAAITALRAQGDPLGLAVADLMHNVRTS